MRLMIYSFEEILAWVFMTELVCNAWLYFGDRSQPAGFPKGCLHLARNQRTHLRFFRKLYLRSRVFKLN